MTFTFRQKRGDAPRRAIVAMVIALIFLSAGYGLYRAVHGEEAPRKRVIETIVLKLVPPPPPPPPREEPPPPPPKVVEQKIEPPPEDRPQDRAQDEPPPEAPIALDAQGTAGSDAFGLAARPGGTPLRLGATGRGGGAGFGRYASLMQDQIGRWLRQKDDLNKNRFQATIRVWLSQAGHMDRVQVLRTTGDTALDRLIEEAIGAMPALSEAPPSAMPQPVIVRIGAVPGVG